MLQCVAVWCRMLQCVAVCSSVLQCVAVCRSVLQCVAVCCSVSQQKDAPLWFTVRWRIDREKEKKELMTNTMN